MFSREMTVIRSDPEGPQRHQMQAHYFHKASQIASYCTHDQQPLHIGKLEGVISVPEHILALSNFTNVLSLVLIATYLLLYILLYQKIFTLDEVFHERT